MKKSNEKFTTFIDGKIVPMGAKTKVGIVFLIVLIPVIAFYFAFYQPNSEKIQGLKAKEVSMQKTLKEVKEKASELAKFEQELKAA